MKCYKCNAEIGSEDIFCGECGASAPKAEAEVKVEVEVKTDTTCPSCGVAIMADEMFCGECGHQIKSEQSDEPEQSENKYPLIPMILTAGLIIILLFIQSQLEYSGLFDDWDVWDNAYLFISVVGCIIASITGGAVGLYVNMRSVRMSRRKFHSFSVFFLVALASFLIVEFLLVMYGPWEEYDNLAYSVSSAAMFAIITSGIIVGLSRLSSRNAEN